MLIISHLCCSGQTNQKDEEQQTKRRETILQDEKRQTIRRETIQKDEKE